MKKLSEEVLNKDEQKRIEYTARQKAIYDYNTLMEENYNRGEAVGIEKGMHIALSKLIDSGMSECQLPPLTLTSFAKKWGLVTIR